jgi:hypothetical protein
MRYFVLVITLLLSVPTFAQTEARNWTKTDCDGVTHSLFSELDAGNVVILDFAMTYMDQAQTVMCSPCSTATKTLEGLHARYEASMPGKVMHYAIAYDDSYDCTQMEKWKAQGKFTVPLILKGGSEVSYYGGMGMPTIVVVGPDHKIYYQKQGFVKKDTNAIKAAVATAFGTMAVPDEGLNSKVLINPNPSSELVSVEAEGEIINAVSLASELGVELWSEEKVGASRMSIPVSTLPNGQYFVKVTTDRGVTIHSVIVNR